MPQQPVKFPDLAAALRSDQQAARAAAARIAVQLQAAAETFGAAAEKIGRSVQVILSSPIWQPPAAAAPDSPEAKTPEGTAS